MAIDWLITLAVALAVWWVERECSVEATQAIVKSVFLSLRLGFEAVIVVVLLRTTFELIGFMETGTSAHISVGLLGIATSISVAVILIRDALRVRVKLNDLDAAQFPLAPEKRTKRCRGFSLRFRSVMSAIVQLRINQSNTECEGSEGIP